MTPEQSDVETLRDEIDALRERVVELESRIDGTDNAESELLDRYDRYVINNVESVADAHPRQIMTLYEESGIVDGKKRKQRTKRLRNLRGEEDA